MDGNKGKFDAEWDALYGGPVADLLSEPQAAGIDDSNDLERIAGILSARSKGYYSRFKTCELQGEKMNAAAAKAVCHELAYLAKEIVGGKLDNLEAKKG